MYMYITYSYLSPGKVGVSLCRLFTSSMYPLCPNRKWCHNCMEPQSLLCMYPNSNNNDEYLHVLVIA